MRLALLLASVGIVAIPAAVASASDNALIGNWALETPGCYPIDKQTFTPGGHKYVVNENSGSRTVTETVVYNVTTVWITVIGDRSGSLYISTVSRAGWNAGSP